MQSVFKVAMLRMLKFAQSAEYAQKNTDKSLPVTQGLPYLKARTLHSIRNPY